MKIRIEIAKNGQLPSQGRNAGSIPAGSTTDNVGAKIDQDTQPVNPFLFVPGRYYRAWFDVTVDQSEFVFFVGWSASNEAVILEDGSTDFHKFKFDEIEFV